MREYRLDEASLAGFFGIIESQPGGYRHLFRGQGNSEWPLVPALYRISDINFFAGSRRKSYDAYEQRSIELFFNEALPYLPAIERGFSNDRILAQHFGVPTRLLDWTRDPLVALFFAVEFCERDSDAAVFMILPEAHFKPEEGSGPQQVIEMHPPAIDRRIPAQKSVFTYHPYGPEDEPFLPLDKRPDIGNLISTDTGSVRGFAKIVISSSAARHLRNTLLNLGIDRRNLFPGLDGVGMDIGARARSGHLLS